jgi:hypothetical protein
VSTATKLTLWTILSFLTAWVLLWPTTTTLTSDDPQLVSVIVSLEALGIVFSLWFGLLLLLAVRAQSHAERVFLVSMAAIVLMGFKLMFVPAGGIEGFWHAAHANFLIQEGRIPFGQSNLTYFEFPGVHLTCAALASITGLTVLQVATCVLFIHAALFASLLYLAFARVVKPNYALIGSLLAIAGGAAYARTSLYPFYWALILLTLFVLLLLPKGQQQSLQTWPQKLIATTVVLALTITHLVTAVATAFILATILLVQHYARRYSVQATASTLIFYSVIFFTWLVYVSTNQFSGLAEVFADLSEEGTLNFPLVIMTANVGARVPPWVTSIRLFWLVVPWSIAGLVLMHNLLRLRRLEAPDRTLSAGLLGILLLSIAAFVIEPSFSQYHKVLTYGPIFLIPLVMRRIPALSKRTLRIAWLGGALLVILSFPTFLAHGDLVSEIRLYEQEARAGEFLSSTADANGEGPTTFSGRPVRSVLPYWVPEASLISEPFLEQIGGRDEFWKYMDSLTSQFLQSEPELSTSMFLFTDRLRFSYRHWFGIPPTDARWDLLEQSLDSTDRIYDDGFAKVYTP